MRQSIHLEITTEKSHAQSHEEQTVQVQILLKVPFQRGNVESSHGERSFEGLRLRDMRKSYKVEEGNEHPSECEFIYSIFFFVSFK